MNIKTDIEIHNKSLKYEIFLNRAYKTNLRIKRANKQEFINLVNTENGAKISILPSFEKQLEEVKNRLEKAIKIFIKKSNSDERISNLKLIERNILKIKSYRDVSEIIEFGLENTQQFI